MANYLLLRSNKESGPFSFEELVKNGLKPYDLVWVQGKSAAWRYPSEVSELKPYAPEVEEQPFDRFFKKPAITEQEHVTVQVKQPAAVADEHEAYAPKVVVADQQKPAAKRSVFVTMPGQVAEKKIVAKQKSPTPIPTPAPIPDYTQEQSEETISIKENPVAKIKYSQPLDEIKEMYVKTLKDRKDRIARKSFMNISLKRAAVVAGLIGIGILAGFILKAKPAANKELAQSISPVNNTPAVTNEQTEIPPQESQPVDVPAETIPVTQTPPVPVSAAKTNPEILDQKHTADPVSRSEEPRRTKEKTVTQTETDPVREVKKPLAVMPPADTKKQDKQEEYAAAETNPLTGERSRTVRTLPEKTSNEVSRSEVDRPSSSANTPASPDKALSGLGTKVNVSSNDYKRVALGGIRNLELTVSNHSKYDLDEVAVELQYLKPGDQVLKTQIVQFKSVAANGTETLRIPDTNRGVKVQYRIVRIGSSQLADR